MSCLWAECVIFCTFYDAKILGHLKNGLRITVSSLVSNLEPGYSSLFLRVFDFLEPAVHIPVRPPNSM